MSAIGSDAYLAQVGTDPAAGVGQGFGLSLKADQLVAPFGDDAEGAFDAAEVFA
ncbi:hypothetical protein [Streptomyces cyaneofuscatus]|uniref:hypothetical protein n=1 Tax=Streptomyces cyaneofuscatus TaxID=66883 RepID=UPI003645FF7F